jgi:hypothetical protein
MQREEEGIDQAWDRFNGLIEQGTRLHRWRTFAYIFLFPNP